MDKPDQIALLIDADNATAARIDVILDDLSGFGQTNIRRAYGNWTKTGLKSWEAVLHEHAIRPVQQFDVTKGKNASDIALAVDAVQMLNTQRPDAFALVSSDADFTPLVMHLREHGARVYGFGDAKTPLPFQSACTRFLVLNRLAAPSTPPDAVAPVADEPPPPATRRRRATAKATTAESTTASAEGTPTTADDTASAAPPAARTTARKKAATKATAEKAAETAAEKAAPARATAPETPARLTRNQLRSDTKLVALLRRTVEGAADDAGWARVSTVGQRISNQSSFDPRNYGYAKLSKLLEATDLFELRDIGGPGMAVRDRRTSTNGTTAGTS